MGRHGVPCTPVASGERCGISGSSVGGEKRSGVRVFREAPDELAIEQGADEPVGSAVGPGLEGHPGFGTNRLIEPGT